jgi:hypothetical protein
MSTVKANNHQIGQSATATNNATWYQPASPDGTVRLGVGNAGATTSDVLVANSSGNVGVGTSSPGSKLTVVGSIAQSTAANGYDAYNASRASRSFCWGLDASGNYGIWDTTSGANNRLLIDSSGNLGLGVTPSAYATLPQFQFSASSTLAGGPSTTMLAQNMAFTSTGAGAKYISTGAASMYYQYGGTHQWYNAPSGTAGNAISYTQAMTLDASGNLVIGGTSGSLGRFSVFGAAASSIELALNTTATYASIQSYSSSPLCINPFGNEVYVNGTTDRGAYALQCNSTGVWGAGAYVNGSDERIKDDISPIQSGLDVVKKMNPVQFRYKEDWSRDQSIQPGFIAQELQVALEGKEYLDGVVQQGPEYMSVAYQTLIPILTKAIQELSAQVTTLQAEINALKA